MTTKTKKPTHRANYWTNSGWANLNWPKLLLILVSLLLLTSFATQPPVAKAEWKAGQDFLSGIGCNDDDKDGLDITDCASSPSSGKVTSFTNFKGDLTPPDATGYAAGLTQAKDARTFILNVTNFALGFLGLLAVLVVIYGGVMSVTSAGEPEKANKGKKAITFAIIGLLVVMGSFALVNTVLLAPSGSEKATGSATGLNTTTIRGVAQNQRFNYLADQIDKAILKIYNSYQFHLLIKQNLDNSVANIDGYSATTSCTSYPFSSCAIQLDNIINNELNIMKNSLNDSAANTPFKTGLADLINKIVAAKTADIPDLIKLSVSEDCEEDNSGLDTNPCTPDNQQAIRAAVAVEREKIVAIFKDTGYDFLKAGYKQDLTEVEVQIAGVAQIVSGIASANLAANLFQELSSSGTGKAILNEITYTSGYLVPTKSLNDPSFNQDKIKKVLSALVQIKAILQNIKFVNAVITADTISGNAPVIVNFSTVGSSDPSGLSVQDDKIQWDLDGNGEYDKGTLSKSGFSSCEEKKPGDTNKATTHCIFTKPGTYRVSVKISPATGKNLSTGLEWSQEIAPGISYIDILVNPASTKINLTANSKPIITYDAATGQIKEDHSNVYFTLSTAKNGINFDATKSTFSDGTTPIANDSNSKIRWNFGVPSTNNDVFEIPSEGSLSKKQAYTENGNYQVKFEVTDKNGVVDSKFFTVVVSNLAPEITNPPLTSKVGQEVTFDGSNSTTDGDPLIFNWQIEKIQPTSTAFVVTKTYAWLNSVAHAALLPGGPSSSISTPKAVTKTPIPTIPVKTLEPTKRSESNQFYNCKMPDGKDDTLNCTFKKAGDYRVTLSLADSKGALHNQSTIISIGSTAPSAGLSISSISKSSPALYKLDGSTLSFDPDETDNSNLEYSWEINPSTCTIIGYADTTSIDALVKAGTDATSSQTPCTKLKDFSPGSQPVIKFNQKGDYAVNLVVRSIDETTSVSDPAEQTVFVDNILDLNWGDMKPSAILKVAGAPTSSRTPSADQLPATINTQPVAPITFLFTSSQAVSFDLDFGDGLSDSGEMTKGVIKTVVHNYTTTGKFTAKLSVFDADDVENKISRNIFIGDSKTPVAIITTRVNDSEIQPEDFDTPDGKTIPNVIVVNRKDNLVFDAEKSLNTDGTGRRLVYAWNIDNGAKQSVSRTISYKFDNVSENGKPYVIKLKTSNEKDPTQNGEDSVNILVVGASPTLRSLTAVPEGQDLTTPVSIKLNAVGAQDADGQISQYKWWYYKASDPATPDNRLGLQITTTPVANITIGTIGLENEKPSYKFGIELIDNDNLIVSSDSQKQESKLNITAPVVQVTNGPNKAPIAKFSVDRTSVQVGESVNFTSASSDPDQGGGIKEYRWDFGDGTKGANLASVPHVYKKANADGYKAKLTVVDNNSSEATSDSIRIFVDAVAQPPVAAFTTKQTPGSKTVQFTNASTVDVDAGAKVKKLTWDFDVTVDSNGDGKKENDLDSSDPNPTYNYAQFGIFRAKVTVEDDQGQTNSVTNFVNVKPASAPAPTPTAGSTSSNSDNIASNNDSSTGSSSSAIKTMGANFFQASNKVDPGLLLASIAAYAILLLISRRKAKKQN